MTSTGDTARRWRLRARTGVATAVLVLGSLVVLSIAERPYPARDWLFFRYATYWLLSAGLLLSCETIGVAVVRRIGGLKMPVTEQLTLAFPVGLLAFTLLVWGFGMLGLLGTTTFVLIPVACFAAGARDTWPLARRLYGHRRILFGRRRSLVGTVAVGCGVIALLLVYAQILTPENTSYDARWYHLAMAETYAYAGRTLHFMEGWMPGGYPQLATFLYTWAFLLPGSILFDRIELACHVEFAVLLATLASIPVLARRVAPRGVRVPGFSWVTLFLFPEIFLYDSNLNGGADHIAAAFAIPLFLAFLRAYRSLDVRSSALLAIVVSGVLSTKFTAYSLIVAPAIALAARALYLVVRRAIARDSKRRWPTGAPVVVGVVAALWAPVWLRNWIWYGDPLFPMLRSVFHSRSWVHTGTAQFEQMLRPRTWAAAPGVDGFLQTLKALYEYAFVSHDWPTFHGDLPIFGFLFTLTLPLLVLFFRARRLLVLYGACHAGIFFWYWTSHQDRYLQVLVPLMAGGVAAVLSGVWTMGLLPRLAASTLVVLQIAWGSDVPFFPTHAMIGISPFTRTLELLSSGFRNKRKERLDAMTPLQEVHRALPADATLLLHEVPDHLGVENRTVSDWLQTQIDYSVDPSPGGVYDVLRRFGVTHVLAFDGASKNADTLGGDIAFHYFLARHASRPERHGPYVLAAMPSARPSNAAFRNRALYAGCPGTYANGLYAITGLDVPVNWDMPATHFPPPLRAVDFHEDPSGLLADVDAVVNNPKCVKSLPLQQMGFVRVATRVDDAIWVRTN